MITPLPTPPLRSDPANFSARGDAFMAALPQFVSEANLLEANTQASSLFGTSSTSNTVGPGSKTFTTQTGKAWTVGSYVTIINTVSPTTLMYGNITAYNTGTGSLTVNVTSTSGSGTITTWSIQTASPLPTIPDDQMDGGTTAGTSTAYTLTPTKALGSYTANKSYMTVFHTASGTSPTLAISGLASPPNLVKRDYTGAYVNIASGDIPTNWKSRVTLVSATQALVEDLPEYLNILDTTRIDVAASPTINLTSLAPNTRHINITGSSVTISTFTVTQGDCYFVRFSGSVTLLNSSGLVTQTSAQIITSPGDTCILRATAANTVELINYVSNRTLTQATSTIAGNFFCRAWVNFDGTGTITLASIRGQGNVSSITDNGTGDYTVNFTNALPDTAFCPVVGGSGSISNPGDVGTNNRSFATTTFTTSSIRVLCADNNGDLAYDLANVNVAVFR